MKASEGRVGRVFVIRLEHGDMIPDCIERFAEEKKISVINDVLCKGCGTCAAACPSAAIIARHFTDEQLFSEIKGVLYDVRA